MGSSEAHFQRSWEPSQLANCKDEPSHASQSLANMTPQKYNNNFKHANIMGNLIPKKDYKGQITGTRAATSDEKLMYGKTVNPYGSVPENANDDIVRILVHYETWNRMNKCWEPTRIKGNKIDKVFTFWSLEAAIEYIPQYMLDKGAEPANKSGKQYYLSEEGYWAKVKVIEDGEEKEKWVLKPYDNQDWNSRGLSFFSQWIIKGKWFMRVTFESWKPVQFIPQNYDYHQQPEEPWSHTAEVKRKDIRGNTVVRKVRTYRGDDPHDTTELTRQARRRERQAIDREEREYYQMTGNRRYTKRTIRRPVLKEALQQREHPKRIKLIQKQWNEANAAGRKRIERSVRKQS